MEYRAQEDEFGCGVACVANLLHVSYKDALNLFLEPQNASWKGYFCLDIIIALQHAGKLYYCFYIKPRKRHLIYQNKTIVFIKRCKKYPSGHYVLRDNESWVDPWINFPRYPRLAGLRMRLPGKPIYAIAVKD